MNHRNQPARRMHRKLLLALSITLVGSAAQAAKIDVDCGAGGKIGDAVAQAKPGDVVAVTGTCRESVFIPRAMVGITLDGQGKATIVGGRADVVPTKPSDFAVFVLGRDITIKGFTIEGGSHGVHLSGPATVLVEGNTIRGATTGIHIDKGSIAAIVGNTIEKHLGAGIMVQEDSYSRIGFRIPTLPQPQGNTIRENQYGVVVARRSNAWIVGNTIAGQRSHGVLVHRHSQADVADNTIEGNQGDGVYASLGSGVTFTSDLSERSDGPNRTAAGARNGGAGARCDTGGYLSGPIGTLAGRDGDAKTDAGCVDRVRRN
jgi:nitrous oxidase accessory protein NosD